MELGSEDLGCDIECEASAHQGFILLNFLQHSKGVASISKADIADTVQEVIKNGEELMVKGSQRYQCYNTTKPSETPTLCRLAKPISVAVSNFAKEFLSTHIKLRDNLLGNNVAIPAQPNIHVDAPVLEIHFPSDPESPIKRLRRSEQQKWARMTILVFIALTDNVVCYDHHDYF